MGKTIKSVLRNDSLNSLRLISKDRGILTNVFLELDLEQKGKQDFKLTTLRSPKLKDVLKLKLTELFLNISPEDKSKFQEKYSLGDIKHSKVMASFVADDLFKNIEISNNGLDNSLSK